MSATPFANLDTLAIHLRQVLIKKKFILLYAYNSTGKTRLSTAFKDLGKKGEGQDTLYFNAFTEDLFSWDNDLNDDSERKLKINSDSSFFAGLAELEMDNRIRPFLNRYADFDFRIDTDKWEIIFSREITNPNYDENAENSDEERTVTEANIKISRGEENIFIWCFFLAVVQLAMDGAEAYKWVKYIYIDDPISSLDEPNAVAVANHLAQMLTQFDGELRTVVSTHHVLFFNVLCNELRKKAFRHFLKKGPQPNGCTLEDVGSVPLFHHLATLVELQTLQQSEAIYTHHFNMLRRVLEQTAGFFGYDAWHDCINPEEGDSDKTLHKRVIDLMSHGDYSIYEPREMMEENKVLFWKVFDDFKKSFPFAPNLFLEESEEAPIS